MENRCGQCGSPKASSIHSVDSTNAEIRKGAHAWIPDDYVCWLVWTHSADRQNNALKICDSDTPGAFRVYRRPWN